MCAQIVIVGTGHSLQVGSDQYTQDQVEKFRAYVLGLCRSYQIKLVAEEMSVDGLSYHGKNSTIPSEVAKQLDIPHQHIDLTRAERIALGIDDGSVASAAMKLSLTDAQVAALSQIFDHVRECNWLARLLTLNLWPTLFVCGASHVSSVERLANCVGQHAVVACYDYCHGYGP